MEFIGDKIRRLREDKELLQNQVNSSFNVRESTWSQYENNKRTPDVETLKKIAMYFSVSTDYLLGITNLKYDPTDVCFRQLIKIFECLTEEEKKDLIQKGEKLRKERGNKCL